MKFFIDTEFVEDGVTIDLISIGIVCEDGRELYLINNECDFSKASDWVKENVIAQLPPKDVNLSDPSISPRVKEESRLWTHRMNIRREVAEFMGAVLPNDNSWHYVLAKDKPKPELWGYYSAYDHIVLCQLFGTMMDLPKGFPMYCMDIKQWCKQLGDPELPQQGKGLHNALADARWNRDVWHFLDNYSKRQRQLLDAMAKVTVEDIAEIFKMHGETIPKPE